MNVPANAIGEQNQQHGERLRRYLVQQQAQVGVERLALPQAGTEHDRPLGAAWKGKYAHPR